MTTAPDPTARTFTSKDAHRNWKLVTDQALRAPVVITAHGRPRHVLLAYDDYQRLNAPAGVSERAALFGRPGGLALLAACRDEIAALCRGYGVTRLEVFGSAARETDFDPDRSDIDLLVTFTPNRRNDMAAFTDFQQALEALLGRRVDLVEREAVEASRNQIRRRRILAEAQPIFG